MIAGQGGKKIQWPHRIVTMSFEHLTVGDAYYWPMMKQAMDELYAADKAGSLDFFEASNGVKITTTNTDNSIEKEVQA